MSALTRECKIVRTTRFGEIEVSPELSIVLQDGLIGLGPSRHFVLVHPDADNPIGWLQSLDEGSLAVPVLEPGVFAPSYSPRISAADAARISLDEGTPQVVLCVLTIPRDRPELMTANLVGPIVINAATRIGRQVIVDDPGYSTKHSVLDSMRLRAATARSVA